MLECSVYGRKRKYRGVRGIGSVREWVSRGLTEKDTSEQTLEGEDVMQGL